VSGDDGDGGGGGGGDPLAPEAGVRLLLELDADHGGLAIYRAAVITPDARFDYRAELGDDGAVALTAVGEPAPEDAATALAQVARLTARAAAGKRDGGLPPWPPRVLRWRGPGRGAP
jgi:hypothetical protein